MPSSSGFSAHPARTRRRNLGVARHLCSRFYVLESGGRMIGEAADFERAIELLENTISGGFDIGERQGLRRDRDIGIR